MSKTVKAIVIAIICEVLYGLYASFSSLWSVVFFILAALGGEIVFLGLWIEEEADKADKKEHLSSFSDEVRRIKLKSKIGWWILMGGIGFEVLAATGLAIRDDWEIRSAIANAKKNDPRNQPISEMTGVVTIIINGPDFAEREQPWDLGLRTMIRLHDPSSPHVNPSGFFGWFENLSATDIKSFNSGSKRVYVIHFEPNVGLELNLAILNGEKISDLLQTNRSQHKIVKDLDSVDDINVFIHFIPSNVEVLGGTVDLLANGQVNKRFFIPPRKGDGKPQNSGDLYLEAFNSNASFVLPNFKK